MSSGCCPCSANLRLSRFGDEGDEMIHLQLVLLLGFCICCYSLATCAASCFKKGEYCNLVLIPILSESECTSVNVFLPYKYKEYDKLKYHS